MDIRKAAEDAARRVAELHAAHVAAVAGQEAMGDADDPLDYERAAGRVRQSLFRLRRAEEKAAKLKECARLAAMVPATLNGQRFVFSWRNKLIFPYPAPVTREDDAGTYALDGFGTRVWGADGKDLFKPDESSLLLITQDDADVIHSGDVPEWVSDYGAFTDRVQQQFMQARQRRREAEIAELDGGLRDAYRRAGVGFIDPVPPKTDVSPQAPPQIRRPRKARAIEHIDIT